MSQKSRVGARLRVCFVSLDYRSPDQAGIGEEKIRRRDWWGLESWGHCKCCTSAKSALANKHVREGKKALIGSSSRNLL